jgi:hypothetical protein
MGEQIGPENLRQILQQATTPSSYQGVVGSGSTTTAVVDAVGGWGTNQWAGWGIQFTDTTTTAALRGVWQQITGNTSNTLTLAAPLPTAPAAGDTYNIRAFGTQVQNVAEWGGAAVEAADATGIVPFRLPYSEAAPGAAAPARAVQVAGSDGTDLRALATTAGGAVLIVKSQGTTATTVTNQKALATSATTPILGTAYTVPANGVLNIAVGIESGATATTSLVTRNGTQYLAINQGNNLTAGAEYDVSIPVAQGDTINFETGAATTLAVLEVFYTEGQG